MAPNGRVVGLDISGTMLGGARRRPCPAGAIPIDFRQADAQVAPLERGAFDVVFSRFGVMFFADPVAAFRNLRESLRSSGRLAVLVWQPLPKNPWIAGPMQALAGVLPAPAPPPPGSAGPFSLGDPARVREVLGGAGWKDIVLDPIEDEVAAGDGRIESSVEFLFKIGPCATMLKDAPRETVDSRASDADQVLRGHRRERPAAPARRDLAGPREGLDGIIAAAPRRGDSCYALSTLARNVGGRRCVRRLLEGVGEPDQRRLRSRRGRRTRSRPAGPARIPAGTVTLG